MEGKRLRVDGHASDRTKRVQISGRSLENELDCLTSENWTVFSWRFQFKNLLRERAMQSVNVACGLIQIKV